MEDNDSCSRPQKFEIGGFVVVVFCGSNETKGNSGS